MANAESDSDVSSDESDLWLSEVGGRRAGRFSSSLLEAMADAGSDSDVNSDELDLWRGN